MAVDARHRLYNFQTIIRVFGQHLQIVNALLITVGLSAASKQGTNVLTAGEDVLAGFLADEVDDWHHLIATDSRIAHPKESAVLHDLLLGLLHCIHQ